MLSPTDMRPTILLPLLALSSLMLGACAVGSDEPPVVLDSAAEALATDADAGYFVVTRRDVRKCATPFCGGWFVKRVNQAETVCADGTAEADCYVSSIELGQLRLSPHEETDIRGAVESGRALVKARTLRSDFAGRTIGTLSVAEAWLGASGGAPTGTFFRVGDNETRCITAPCPSMTAYALNDDARHDVVDVVLDRTQVPAENSKLKRARAALGTKEGILVAGSLVSLECTRAPDCPLSVVASEFYLRVIRREGQTCSSWQTFDCNEGQYCHYGREGLCGAAIASGECLYKPVICAMIYMPVCGCDGKTYPNACAASGDGTSVAFEGRCPSW